MKLHDGPSFQKEGKTVEIEGLDGGGGRMRTNVCLSPPLHILN